MRVAKKLFYAEGTALMSAVIDWSSFSVQRRKSSSSNGERKWQRHCSPVWVHEAHFETHPFLINSGETGMSASTTAGSFSPHILIKTFFDFSDCSKYNWRKKKDSKDKKCVQWHKLAVKLGKRTVAPILLYNITIQTSFVFYFYFYFLIENHSSANTTIFRNYILEQLICGKL